MEKFSFLKCGAIMVVLIILLQFHWKIEAVTSDRYTLFFPKIKW